LRQYDGVIGAGVVDVEVTISIDGKGVQWLLWGTGKCLEGE